MEEFNRSIDERFAAHQEEIDSVKVEMKEMKSKLDLVVEMMKKIQDHTLNPEGKEVEETRSSIHVQQAPATYLLPDQYQDRKQVQDQLDTLKQPDNHDLPSSISSKDLLVPTLTGVDVVRKSANQDMINDVRVYGIQQEMIETTKEEQYEVQCINEHKVFDEMPERQLNDTNKEVHCSFYYYDLVNVLIVFDDVFVSEISDWKVIMNGYRFAYVRGVRAWYVSNDIWPLKIFRNNMVSSKDDGTSTTHWVAEMGVEPDGTHTIIEQHYEGYGKLVDNMSQRYQDVTNYNVESVRLLALEYNGELVFKKSIRTHLGTGRRYDQRCEGFDHAGQNDACDIHTVLSFPDLIYCTVKATQVQDNQGRHKSFTAGNVLEEAATCHYSYSFCWSCTEEAHRPVDCSIVAKWIFSAETEKNQGSMHIPCTSPCKFMFCWLCLDALTEYGEKTGGLDACNCYEHAKQQRAYDDAERRREMAQNSLENYIPYYESWATKQSSRQKVVADLQHMQTLHPEKLSNTQCQPESQLKFIIEAWHQIVECRWALKWTYTYGYYLPEREHTKIQFYEYLQGEAESSLERLHQGAEKDLECYLYLNTDGKACWIQTKLAGLTSVTHTYFESLVQALKNVYQMWTRVVQAVDQVAQELGVAIDLKKLLLGRYPTMKLNFILLMLEDKHMEKGRVIVMTQLLKTKQNAALQA